MSPVIKWGFIAAGVLMIGIPAISFLGSAGKTVSAVATAPGRVIQRTLETDNIIHNYEWFHDTWAAYRAKLDQIATHSSLLDEAEDSRERSQIRTEVAAMRQKCRSLAEQYRANATKTNRGIFQGREAPETLDPQTCN